ncbi:hypothetical protein IWZ00DRAFT_490369 [Phyllosticta capitalensis]|uniref:Secreted protein n=1 Tax=Phyllosticta capitalensis TaxID=121624 RepID=A0ABR1YIG0_9PEZI
MPCPRPPLLSVCSLLLLTLLYPTPPPYLRTLAYPYIPTASANPSRQQIPDLPRLPTPANMYCIPTSLLTPLTAPPRRAPRANHVDQRFAAQRSAAQRRACTCVHGCVSQVAGESVTGIGRWMR